MSTETVQDERRWWSKALLVGAVIGLVALPLGALGTKFGIWQFTFGFMLLAVGVVLATVAFFLGIIGAVHSNIKKRTEDRKSCLIAVAIGVVILGLMGNQYMTAQSVPPIHNISTDTTNPPQFDKIVAIREASQSNPLAYDAAQLAEPQRKAYPYVKSLITPTAPGEMLNRTVAALEDMGLEVVNADQDEGRVEATDTTFWFGFKDDVVVRIREEGTGSIVDIRSVSRVGQSDLGKNAQRIGQILNAIGGS